MRFIVLVIVSLLAGISWWLSKESGQATIEFAKVSPQHSIDYFSRGYTKFEMDENGRPKSKLVADALEHYVDTGETYLDNPVMTFYNAQTAPWVIKSQTGLLSADGEDLFLNGKVLVTRAGTAHARQVIINTSNARVKPALSYAESDEWSEVHFPPDVTKGTGMELYFVEPIRLKLLSNVRGVYGEK